ncbi:similar to Saccharomyces cerevisiae YIL061C SNP1 Component of U1 snRNP required for mRNA splicing via spliceosome [Maudiozyma barnettii]|uniref:Similar to Saccharomyces cerevisiae YIL061C SNP1 Component of U1 snRNP required for mRNA splicing via spliceosome n=1 Tax=Maudiozyma barnettii TaxID=61262 RepID=A0A8H2ZHJ6_9SACH|nr:U1 snRNP complex subunit SNP1 [Kazachstania barnettii]CAB4254013.1 similar to Saccharomyces cerevisiae YIL061C SNP1 Component of U1 snRNP required for mRNA splicing via spliceosome [Kazachstania barnettii]CAD1781763.1 similar to Saccharomyces cerevisiae YIL061C SNP1 Component of U1 snRNP required for mRNA splicing via spliceosome [Kazachstania barnettii]
MYNLSKYPNDVAQLFAPPPPLPYKNPIDYPPQERRTISDISPVSKILEKELSEYYKQFPKGTPNRQFQPQTNIKHRLRRNNKLIQERLRQWDPNNDIHMAQTDPFRTIFVGRLPYTATEVDLQKVFGNYGAIEKIRVVRDRESNSKGYGFVVFVDPMAAKTTTRECGVHRGIEISGHRCIVDIERGRTTKYFTPRRLGGGLGGRGYTQQNQSLPQSQFSSQHSRVPFNRPSRFTRGPIPQHQPYQDEIPLESVATTSYKSRTTRTLDNNDNSAKSEMPDY